MLLEDLIGNEKNKQIIKQTVKTGNVLHSYLFLGPEGIGKTLFAKEFAKMLLCLGEEKPCNKCRACLQMEEGNHPDFILLEPDGGTIKIKQIRDMLAKTIEKPIVSSRKVYILKDADKMTKEAQNSLLKTLEEPPEYIVIILIAAHQNNLLTTIQSRCTKIVFDKIPAEEVIRYLESNYADIKLTEGMQEVVNGSIGKALALKDSFTMYQKLEELIMNIEEKDKLDFIKEAEWLLKEKENIFSLLEYMNVEFVRKGKQGNIAYINCIPVVEQTIQKLKYNANFDMHIDDLILKIWEEIHGKRNCRSSI